MAIDKKDFMHGAALVAIADSPNFTALNKASVKYGHYIVNQDRNVFIKYCSAPRVNTCTYAFTFDAEDKQRIADTLGRGHVFVVMVCGEMVITAITGDDFLAMVDVDAGNSSALTVTADPGKRLRVASRSTNLAPIARNAFPSMVLS
ncbi:hypothetical protein [Rhodococcus sp. NPDC004095]